MINEQGKVTIVDFGHTKRIDGGKTFSICGTTHSMPPEIYKSEGYSYEFDYYGFGILIYEMLTGKAPYGYSNTNPNIIEGKF
jgi:serine/threonine protein kinase